MFRNLRRTVRDASDFDDADRRVGMLADQARQFDRIVETFGRLMEGREDVVAVIASGFAAVAQTQLDAGPIDDVLQGGRIDSDHADVTHAIAQPWLHPVRERGAVAAA